MPWTEHSVSDQRKILVSLSQAPGANLSELAKRFGVSRKTLYKWRNRAGVQPSLSGEWAENQSRRPQSSPGRLNADMEQRIREVREQSGWGPRKIRKVLEMRGVQNLPSPSTIAAVLRRLDLVEPEESLKRKEFVRFERSEPNELWQMDFKGPFPIGNGARCHPLTIVDDHSRFALGVQALPGESGELTRPALIPILRRYGLPDTMLLDNGSCWGRVGACYTAFTAWLLRLGIRVIYGRPYHPQTRGKNERFNRTLKAEAIAGRHFATMQEWQAEFDRFVLTYNTIRPHEALSLEVPASRYKVSARSFPEQLEPIEYLEGDTIRKVGPAGYISWGKQRFHVGRAFSGEPVAMRPTRIDGVYEVFYCYQQVAVVDRRDGSCQQT